MIIATWVHYQMFLSVSGEEKYKKLQSDFLKQEQMFNDLFKKLTSIPIDNVISLVDFCEKNKVDKNTFAFFVYRDSLLLAWSSNEITPSKCWKDSLPCILQINNRWVYVKQTKTQNNQYIGYLIINDVCEEDEQEENNGIISNPVEHNPVFDATQDGDTKKCYTVCDQSGKPVFSLIIPDKLKKNNKKAFFEMILWLIVLTASFFTLISFLLLTKFFSKNTNFLFLFLILLLLITSVISRFIHCTSDLFSPIYYSSHFSSLGMLFFNAYLLLLASVFYMQFACLENMESYAKKTKIIISSMVIFFVLVYYIVVYLIITGITNDSVVVLKPEMIHRYDLLSIIAVSSIVFILWSAFMVTYKSLNQIFLFLQNRVNFIRIIVIELTVSTILFVVLCFAFSNRASNLYISYVLFLLLLIVTTIFVLHKKKWHNLLFNCIIYLILSSIVLITANQTVDAREKKYKEAMAEMILSTENPYVVDSFRDLVSEIKKDTEIISMFEINPLPVADLQQHIILKYAKRYAEHYRVSVDVNLVSSLEDSIKRNQKQPPFAVSNQKLLDSNVSFRRIGFGKSEYIVKASVPVNSGKDVGNISIIFRMYILSNQLSELEKTLQKEMSNYCYAGYENNILTASAGNRNISYLFNLADYHLDTLYSGMEFISNNVTHTVFTHDKKVILVSSQKNIIWDKISFLVILFLAEFIFLLLPLFLSYSYHNPQNLWRLGFQESIQFFVTILVTLTVIVTAFSFSRFFQIQRNNNLEDVQSQMSQRINKNITSSIAEIDTLSDLSEDALHLINKELSASYEFDFLNLNLYNKNGVNVKGYGRGIYVNAYLNPFAFKSLVHNQANVFIANETFDKEEYKSFYEAIPNKDGEIIGYSNVFSYHNKQKDMLDYRQTLFLTKFMASCLVIILLIVILSIILMRRLTRPLIKVTERLSVIKLGKELKEIEWNKDDELGELVRTYNILIQRLQSSAELLEKSSQEIAWKSMARQIAHEIKNPLTPIRLTTQQMLRTLNTEKSINAEKLKNYFSMIIQQTDTLAEIANSFSNFSKINQKEGAPEDLIPIIHNTLSSFNENPNITFLLVNQTNHDEVISFVNKSQMSQVFNNLIKNAIQARKPNTTQSISIEIKNYGDKMWQIIITDTGTGMTEDVKEKIFSPNFTTKTSGTGLGLAMVQRIIVTWGGNISFTSTYNVGTSFFITLPKYTPLQD
jgi:signal transduction histidine kinase